MTLPVVDVLAVVGSVGFVDESGLEQARDWIEAVLARRRPDVVVSGGAAGVDTVAVAVARARGIEVREFLPSHRRWQPDGFKARNDLIAGSCSRLLRICCRWSRTYGSGYTLDRAVALRKPTMQVRVPSSVEVGVLLLPDRRGGRLEVEVAGGQVCDGSAAVRALGWVGRSADDLVGELRRAGVKVSWRSRRDGVAA